MIILRELSRIRNLVKSRDCKSFFLSPLNIIWLILFLLRSSYLRIFPQKEIYYFISQSIHLIKPITKRKEGIFHFEIIDSITKELSGFIKARYEEASDTSLENYTNKIIKEFTHGDKAFVLVENQVIVSVFFVSFSDTYISSLNYTYCPSANEVLIYDIYTLKKKRNSGLYTLLLSFAIEYFKKNEIQNVTMWIMKHNKATIIAQQKAGFKHIKRKVTFYTWLGMKKTIVRDEQIQLEDL